MNQLNKLNQIISSCGQCPRLVQFRETLPKRTAYQNEVYLRQPNLGFGDPQAYLLILGLAPSAHGGNRVGRIFTGDESGKFLMKMLYLAGFANQPTSTSLDDGLILKKCYITAAVKCVPPQNKPIKKESETCFHYLEQEFALLPHLRGVLALGQFAYQTAFRLLDRKSCVMNKKKFRHGLSVMINKYTLFASYHPSPQNTYTGKLTEQSLLSLLRNIKDKLDF